MVASNLLIPKMQLKIGIVGATGAVGQQMLRLMEKRDYQKCSFKLFASEKSEGRIISIFNQKIAVESLCLDAFKDLDLVFFDASDAVSAQWVPVALNSGCWVVDHSAAFRMSDNTPLVVPEINFPNILPEKRLMTGPNCTTVQLVMALKPIQDYWGLKRVIVSSYQSCSGAGQQGLETLEQQTLQVLNGQEVHSFAPFQTQIAYNCIPQIGSFQSDNYTSEENKIIQESKKILNEPNLRITATAVRVPTRFGHGESVNIETQRPFKLAEVAEALKAFSGVCFYEEGYPTHLLQEKELSVGVGRLRRDFSTEHALNIWIVADNLYKGAAWNALQIGEYLFQKGAFKNK